MELRGIEPLSKTTVSTAYTQFLVVWQDQIQNTHRGTRTPTTMSLEPKPSASTNSARWAFAVGVIAVNVAKIPTAVKITSFVVHLNSLVTPLV